MSCGICKKLILENRTWNCNNCIQINHEFCVFKTLFLEKKKEFTCVCNHKVELNIKENLCQIHYQLDGLICDLNKCQRFKHCVCGIQVVPCYQEESICQYCLLDGDFKTLGLLLEIIYQFNIDTNNSNLKIENNIIKYVENNYIMKNILLNTDDIVPNSVIKSFFE